MATVESQMAVQKEAPPPAAQPKPENLAELLRDCAVSEPALMPLADHASQLAFEMDSLRGRFEAARRLEEAGEVSTDEILQLDAEGSQTLDRIVAGCRELEQSLEGKVAFLPDGRAILYEEVKTLTSFGLSRPTPLNLSLPVSQWPEWQYDLVKGCTIVHGKITKFKLPSGAWLPHPTHLAPFLDRISISVERGEGGVIKILGIENGALITDHPEEQHKLNIAPDPILIIVDVQHDFLPLPAPLRSSTSD